MKIPKTNGTANLNTFSQKNNAKPFDSVLKKADPIPEI